MEVALEKDPENLPRVLTERPDLSVYEEYYWSGFVALSQGRSVGMSGSNPIALSDVYNYFTFNEIIELDERDDFLYFIKELDREFLKLEAAKIKAGGKG